MLGFLKKRISGVSDKRSQRNNKSSALGSYLNKAFQSTPDLLKTKTAGQHQSISTESLHHASFGNFDTLQCNEVRPANGSKVDTAVTHRSRTHHSGLKDLPNPPPLTEVLFSPSKGATNSGDGRKLKFRFEFRKNKSVDQLRSTRNAAYKMPVITLTTPGDEQEYILHRPIPLVLCKKSLSVPTRSYSNEYTSGTSKFCAKSWPHPAGPWLRPSASEEYALYLKSDRSDFLKGWRLGTGKVIGWEPGWMEALGITLPPQLPTEQDLNKMALVQQISMNLDRAQNALYGTLDEGWDEEMEDDEGVKFIEEAWNAPPWIGFPHEVWTSELLQENKYT